MFAALPMYARPQNRAAHDALWGLIRDGLRRRGLSAPDALDHAAAFDAGWGRPDLVLGHICNLPWRAMHRDNTQIVGASDYAASAVAPGYYQALYVVRRDDPAQAFADVQDHPMAVNEPLSHSGWGAPQADAASRGMTLSPALLTGGHAASIAAVASGKADFASIDAQVWQIETSLGNPHTRALRIIGASPRAPGITFITAPGRDVDATFDAVAEAIKALPDPHKTTLGLRGIVRLPRTAYDIPLPPAPVLRGTVKTV